MRRKRILNSGKTGHKTGPGFLLVTVINVVLTFTGLLQCRQSALQTHGCMQCHTVQTESIGPSLKKIASVYCETEQSSLADFLKAGLKPRLTEKLTAMETILKSAELDETQRQALAEEILKEGGCDRLRVSNDSG